MLLLKSWNKLNVYVRPVFFSLLIILIAFPQQIAQAFVNEEISLNPGSSLYSSLSNKNDDETPGNVSSDWLYQVQQNLKTREYQITWQDQPILTELSGAYQAPNRAHNFRSFFNKQGIRIISRKAVKSEGINWKFGMRLSGYGSASAIEKINEPAALVVQGNRIEYQYGAAFTEWYINNDQGLEQGFTINYALTNNSTEPTVLELLLSGNLIPKINAGDPGVLLLQTGNRITQLNYGKLKAFDSTGKGLSVGMQLLNGEKGNSEHYKLNILVDTQEARYPITIDPSITSQSPVIIESDQSNAQFGNSVSTAGDINGDGYSDVIIGAFNYDNGQTDEGAAFVFYGSANGLITTSSWMGESNQASAKFGSSVGTAGDVNGDGFSDVIVGAYYYDNGETDEGRAYVYYGSASGLSATANWTAESNQAAAYFGSSVSTAGDVNGDGFDDVVVGAYYYDNGQSNEGAAFLYYGSATGLSTIANWTTEGNQSSARFGGSVSTAGDINGDGFDDVIIGANYYDKGESDEGAAFVFYGSTSGLSTTANWVGKGNQILAKYGSSVSTAGDVNGDGFSDVIVGAYEYDSDQPDEGAAFVYYGSPAGLGTGASWVAEGDQELSGFGYAVSTAGDVNGDGFSDIVIGSSTFDNGQWDEGEVFVYLGTAGGLSPSENWVGESNQDGANFGIAVSTAGDINRDGYDDVIVGSYSYDNGQSNEGAAFIFQGAIDGIAGTTRPDWWSKNNQNSEGFVIAAGGDINGDGFPDVVVGASTYDGGLVDEGAVFAYHGSSTGLSTSPNWVVEGQQEYAGFGYSVGSASSINGDRFSDIIVGAPYFDNGQTDEGAAFIFYGSSNGLSITANWTSESNQAYARFGSSVSAAGDINNDTYQDVVVGAPDFDDGQIDEGKAFVYYGTATGPGTTPNWSVEGNQVFAHYGNAVATAGDVNKDGYSDVIVGAFYFDNGQTDEGRVFVYYGSAGGLSSTANWTAESNQSSATFGSTVGSAGDVNKDGYSDIIVGAPYYDNGQTDEGRAYVYYGSATGLSATANWTAESNQASAKYGNAVSSAGDVNGDGYSDVVVGAYYYDNGQTNEGAAFVYYGSASGLNTSASWTGESNISDAKYGYSVASAGDVNGDGFSDVIVSAFDYNDGQVDGGAAFLYRGSSNGLSTTSSWKTAASPDSSLFTSSLNTAGDVNGDGYSDVIIGAYDYDNGQTDEGAAFVFYGSVKGLSTSPNWMGESNQAYSSYGYSVSTAGDVNGDGYSDVIVGAHYYDNGQSDEGRAFVYYGSANGLPAEANWTAESNQASAYYGNAVSTAGDVNGDGFSDVIVSAYYYDNGQSDEGAVFVYYGSTTGLSITANWTAESNQASSRFGCSVNMAGDVNGDGYGDVIVGSNYYDKGQTDEGAAFVYHGSASGLSASPNWIGESNQASARYGNSVSTAGDVNGDGFSDVIVGAYYYDNGETDEGAAFVYYGASSGLNTTANWMAEGNQASARLGNAVSTVGDMNGDGYGDIIVGVYKYDNGQTDEGKITAYYGSASGLSISPNWSSEGNEASKEFGYSVRIAGDVNGDGFSDVIAGSSYGSTAFAYHGSASGLGKTPAWLTESNQASAFLGWSVNSAGDVNGDGYSDVIVGAPNATNGQTDEGAAYLYYGSADGISGTPDWTAEGDQANAHFGWAVNAAGDVNGDGYGDIVIGAVGCSKPEISEGCAYVYLGSASGVNTDPAWFVEGNQSHAAFGYTVGAAGDVNGDGFSDIFVGAPNYDNTQKDAGITYVYFGSSSGPSSNISWSIAGDQENELLGLAVSSAGDINGDGFSDLIIGAPNASNGQAEEGKALVYAGSAAGLGTTSAWTLESNQARAHLGEAVSSAGDVNRDGYSDVLIGAPDYDQGESDSGNAFLFLGSVSGLSTQLTWSGESNQAGANFGVSVGTAGDINGDGYSDILVGANRLAEGQENEGKVYGYFGASSGIDSNRYWAAKGNQPFANFGYALGTAGDVNGDGFSDVVIGAHQLDQDQVDEGQIFLYHGGGAGGVKFLPQQVQSDLSKVIQPLGSAYSNNAFNIQVFGHTPMGRMKVKLEWEVKPVGTAFDGVNLRSSSYWIDTGVDGMQLQALVSNLAPSTSYHWRVRIRYQSNGSPFIQHSRWISIAGNALNETDLKTGN